ncbi:S41 family peptidase [Patescibacteria group bacterium]|nr:S41 family peptidase [Patescibacteria group bacterium]
MHNYYPKKHNYFIYILIASMSFVFGWQATSYGLIDGEAGVIDKEVVRESADMNLFWTVWEELQNKYVNEDLLDEKTMVYGAIKGMVGALDDPYTVYMNPEESEEFSASLGGTLEGIGAELTVEDGALTIVSPLRDSPAERAGLLPGDIIFRVEEDFTAEMTLFEAIMNIRGEAGTDVSLTIIRDGEDDPFEVTITRASIDLESVSFEDLGDGLFYISINQFNDRTAIEFNDAISQIILEEAKGLIIDLRYNGGGYLDISVDLLSYLLPSNSVAVEIRQKDESENSMMYTNGSQKLLNVPLVVLVNEGSASASEILAGAVQDHKRGLVMGTASFGKGTVQEVETFADGSSIRMTIAKWFTPDGRSINEVGIAPDIVVEISDEDIENEYDRQKQEAIEYLKAF